MARRCDGGLMNHYVKRYRSALKTIPHRLSILDIWTCSKRCTDNSYVATFRTAVFTFVEAFNDSTKPLRIAESDGYFISWWFAFSRRYSDIVISPGQRTGSRRKTICAVRALCIIRIFVILKELKGHASERSQLKGCSYALRNIIDTLSRLIAA